MSGRDLEEAGHDLASFAFYNLCERRSVEGRLGADVDGTCAVLPRPVDEVGGRVDRARGADDQHQGGFGDLCVDAIHFQRNLTKEDDVRAQASSAGAAGYFGKALVDAAVGDGRAAALTLAAGHVKRAVHVDEALRAGLFMQVVDILGTKEEAVADLGFELGQGDVRGVRLSLLSGGAALGIELPDRPGIALPGFGGADLFDAMTGPEAVFCAEGGQAALRADARAGEDKDAIFRCDGNGGHLIAPFLRNDGREDNALPGRVHLS